jgi:hypothetical protein
MPRVFKHIFLPVVKQVLTVMVLSQNRLQRIAQRLLLSMSQYGTHLRDLKCSIYKVTIGPKTKLWPDVRSMILKLDLLHIVNLNRLTGLVPTGVQLAGYQIRIPLIIQLLFQDLVVEMPRVFKHIFLPVVKLALTVMVLSHPNQET